MKHPWFKDTDFKKILNQEVKASYLPKVEEIDDDEEDSLLKYHSNLKEKKKSKFNKQELLETCLAESRKRLIRDYQQEFEAF